MGKPYYQDSYVTQYCDDALSVLSELESDSIDLLCSDPPYGISFMSKDWDKALPDKQIWAECLRVLKPGAFAFVMSIPRSDCLSRMIISLEDAGFRVDFSPIYWAYASGFPKAQNIGKAVDKRPLNMSEFARLIKNRRIELKLSTIDVAESGHFYGDVNHGGSVSNWESGLNVPTLEEYNKLIEILQFKDKPKIKRVYREVTGKDKTRSNKDNIPFVYRGEFDRKDKPATPQAKALDGSYGGFQPKPAVEVIIVAMKPLSEKTFVDQALKNQKGITWLDDCRIPYESEGDKSSMDIRHYTNEDCFQNIKPKESKFQVKPPNLSGRFPANLLCSDDVMNDGRVRKSTGGCVAKDTQGFACNNQFMNYGDSGSFSRYFDLDAWWAKTFPFLITPKASKSEKNRGLSGDGETRKDSDPRLGGGSDDWGDRIGGSSIAQAKRLNSHPTVKPLKLISYLITLGSRPGDVILDPFGGSGTTALAAKLLGRKCIIVELEEKYCEIAAARCSQEVMKLDI